MTNTIAGLILAVAWVTLPQPDQPFVTVDGVDYPVCAVEDCSDQPGQIGVWRNDGKSYLSLGEYSVEVKP